MKLNRKVYSLNVISPIKTKSNIKALKIVKKNEEEGKGLALFRMINKDHYKSERNLSKDNRKGSNRIGERKEDNLSGLSFNRNCTPSTFSSIYATFKDYCPSSVFRFRSTKSKKKTTEAGNPSLLISQKRIVPFKKQKKYSNF